MLTKIKHILESEKAECFCTAFLFHCVLIAIFSLIIGDIIDTTNIEIMIVSNPTDKDFEETVIIIPEEIYKFNEENISFKENDTLETQEDSSLSIGDLETPQIQNAEIYNPDICDIRLFPINENITGLSSFMGAGFSQQQTSGGAIDRLTKEIIFNAEQKDTNVIWLLDASISLTHQREFISNRLDKILTELKFANTNYDILHGVYGFGKSLYQMTQHLTEDLNTLKLAISSISIDESGIENTFGAIGEICKKYSTNNTRLMIIVFTDEVGDDIHLLDLVSRYANTKDCVIYAVGNPAPFGKSTTQFRFVDFDPNYDQSEKWVEINQGPEDLYDLTLDIKTLPIDNETLDSGFGPFALSKLCLDTGGVFFGVHPNRSSSKVNRKDVSPLSSYISRFFEHKVMMKYKPDYRSVLTQSKEYSVDKIKYSLVEASKIPLHISDHQVMKFKSYNEGQFAEQLSMAQRFSAKIEPKINKIHSILSDAEKHISSIKEKRILASYYLAMGRILATKCRIESYNLILAEAKSGIKKKDPKSNVWILLPSKEFKVNNSVLNKAYDSSHRYLKYIVENFPDTPWALIAQEELNTPIGYIWSEFYEEPPKSNNGGGGNNRQMDDNPGKKLLPKPQRKIDKI